MTRKTHVWFVVCTVIGLIALGVIVFERSYVAGLRERIRGVDETDSIAWGAMLFETRACAGCHVIDDPTKRAVIGPNLSAIATRAGAQYIRRAILTPDTELAADCGANPCRPGVMPPYRDVLEPAQVDALVAFLLTRDGTSNE